jgi:hypothetical protein
MTGMEGQSVTSETAGSACVSAAENFYKLSAPGSQGIDICDGPVDEA